MKAQLRMQGVCGQSWAARYTTWVLIKLTPKGLVFSFLCFSFLFCVGKIRLADRRCVCRAGAAAGGGGVLWGSAHARQQGSEGERQQLPGL